MRIQVKDFMSSPVTSAIGDQSVSELMSLMKRESIHAVPVIEYSKKFPVIEYSIRGIITDTDFKKGTEEDIKIKDVMTKTVHVIHKDSSAQAAAKMMRKHKVRHLIVMDDGKIIGMISSQDFVKLVAEHKLD